jgi:hypothetical protein
MFVTESIKMPREKKGGKFINYYVKREFVHIEKEC